MATPIRSVGFDFDARAGASYEFREIEIWAEGRNVVLNQTITGESAAGNSDFAAINDGNVSTIYSETGDWLSVFIDIDATDITSIDSYVINVEPGGCPEEIVFSISDTPGQFGGSSQVDSHTGLDWDGTQTFTGPFAFDEPASIDDPGHNIGVSMPSGDATLTATVNDDGHAISVYLSPGDVVQSVAVVDPGHIVSASIGFPWISIEPNVGSQLTTIYRCTLETAGDPGDYVTIPMQSFQTRLQNGNPSWLQIVAPNVVQSQAEIADRIDGVLRVYQGTRDQEGNETWGELSWCNLTQYQIQIGAISSTAILGGNGVEETTAPKVLALQEVTYRANNVGNRQVRAKPDRNLRPGDTVTFGGSSFVVGQVQHSIGQASSQMDVFEVEAA